MIKGILIDPTLPHSMYGGLPNFSNVEVGHYTDIVKHIGCSLFTCVRFPDGKHIAYVDDEGLINGTELGVQFTKDIYPEPLAGRILILGDDGKGGDADCELDIAEVQAKVKGIVQFSM